ncbi:MAG: hypothetical protein RMJ56_09725 [Gemmataceae bacterium]|nr:hypothetical protein [Gemmata sp.]MDW8197868.1 hypothetical protein [Gemmataceae bacterium]
MTWDVLGGRDSYQIAAERTTDERLEWHCTCPDAVYRSARQPHHRCKHVQGLLAWLHQRETKPLAATSSHNG